ncbi:MAG: HAD hydrolase family protein, partial [Anaerolineae bacterium]
RSVVWVARELGIDLNHVMAIGDAENDRDMIELVGLGIAMGNAPESLKAAARYVTAANDEDGVAEALEKFVLPKPAAVETPAPAVARVEDTEEDNDDA